MQETKTATASSPHPHLFIDKQVKYEQVMSLLFAKLESHYATLLTNYIINITLIDFVDGHVQICRIVYFYTG